MKFELPLLHADSFDRQIIARALAEKIPWWPPTAASSCISGWK